MLVELTHGVISDVSEIGGKGNSLLRLVNAGFNVPNGFVIPASYFLDTLKANGVYEKATGLCANTSLDNFKENSEILHNIIINCNIGFNIDEPAKKLKMPVAVRSSSISEDGENYSFAGLHDSFLNVAMEDIVINIKKVWASLFNDRALFYLLHKGLPLFEGIAVIVLEMVEAEYAGVVFTRHPIEQNSILVEITSGIGEELVGGSVIPDRYLFNRKTLAVSSVELAQSVTMDEKTVKTLVDKCMEIEELYGKPQDIEWAVSDKLYFLQSRDVVLVNDIHNKVIDIEQKHNWTLISSKISPALWKSWTAKGNTRNSLLKNTAEDIFIAMKQEELFYLKDTEDHQKVRDYYESVFARDIDHFYRVQDRCMAVHKDFIDFCSENRKNDYTQLNNEEIIAVFARYIEKIIATASFRTNIFLLGHIITDLINEELERIKLAGIEYDFYYELVTPIKDLPLTEMQKNILLICERIEQDNLDLAGKGVQSLVEDHLEKYSWLTTHRYFGEPLTPDDVLQTVKDNLGEYRQKIAAINYDNAKRKAELDKIKNINATIEKLIDIAQNYTYLQTYRLDVVNEGNHYLRSMFNEICRRTKMAYDSLIYLTEEEIIEALKGNEFDYNQLASARKEYYVIYNVNDDEIHIFEGINNKYITLEEETEEDIKTDVLRGKVAQRGRTKGTVKVIKSKQELGKLNDGDIIVCPMTMPEMVIGLLKCSGIITDEGGITCHAAQISRELKVPCVIGTGNASRILDDGDIVEIIAEGINGEVKILK